MKEFETISGLLTYRTDWESKAFCLERNGGTVMLGVENSSQTAKVIHASEGINARDSLLLLKIC